VFEIEREMKKKKKKKVV